MVSLFDTRGSDTTGLPVDLVARGGRGISLLEFFAVDEAPAEAAPAPPVPEPCEPAEPTLEQAAQAHALELRAMVDAARDQAAAETRLQCEAEAQARMAEERQRITHVCAEFARDRQRYFAAAEAQVVKLALAIARRVLAQEVQGNVLHLLPTVRAALQRVQDGSLSTLQVPAAELSAWRDALAPERSVEVAVGDQLGAGEYLLETNLGRMELGIDPQLDEVERGFDELLQRGAA